MLYAFIPPILVHKYIPNLAEKMFHQMVSLVKYFTSKRGRTSGKERNTAIIKDTGSEKAVVKSA